MIEFKTSTGEKVSLSYAEVAREFVDSPLADEERDIAINLMLFMDYLGRKRDLKFEKMNKSDWDKLWHEAKKLMTRESLKVA